MNAYLLSAKGAEAILDRVLPLKGGSLVDIISGCNIYIYNNDGKEERKKFLNVFKFT